MVLLIEGGLAEEPRAALGGAGGKGHGLQHCIENDKDNNSQDKTGQRQYKKSRLLQGFSTVSTKQIPNNSIRRGKDTSLQSV